MQVVMVNGVVVMENDDTISVSHKNGLHVDLANINYYQTLEIIRIAGETTHNDGHLQGWHEGYVRGYSDGEDSVEEVDSETTVEKIISGDEGKIRLKRCLRGEGYSLFNNVEIPIDYDVMRDILQDAFDKVYSEGYQQSSKRYARET